MCGSSGNKLVGDALSGGGTKLLDMTGNDNLPGGATTDQVRKSFYDPVGLFGGGGDQLWSKAGFTGGADTPDVITRDPVAEEASARNAAGKAANAAKADRRRRAKASSLLAAGGEGGLIKPSGSLLAQGKTTLG